MSQLKVLFIAPYLQDDGWGRASQAFIHSLKDKCDLSVRNLYLGPDKCRIKEELFPNLQKRYDRYDAVIQKVLPNLFHYDSRCGINCGISCLETKGMNPEWRYHFGLMDKVFTFTDYERENNRWLSQNVFTVGEPIDTSIYSNRYEPIKELGEEFKFYFIGENIERKSLSTLLKCYFQEFSAKDNVSLVIKSGARKELEEIAAKIQHGLRRFFDVKMYPMIRYIDGKIPDEMMYRIHCSCDCFVMPSKGEAFCIPLLNALGFNNQIIINKNTSMSEIADIDNAWHCKSTSESIYCQDPPLADIYTTNEKWSVIDENDLRRSMREAYLGKKRIKNREAIINRYSYDSVGKNIIKCLQS